MEEKRNRFWRRTEITAVITPADGVNLNYEHPLPPKDNYEHPLPPKDKVFSALVILASLLAIMFALTVWLIGFDKVGAAVFCRTPCTVAILG